METDRIPAGPIVATHEVNIFTADGWVISLQSDKDIDLRGITLTSVIVAPRADFSDRMKRDFHSVPMERTIYQLGTQETQFKLIDVQDDSEPMKFGEKA